MINDWDLSTSVERTTNPLTTKGAVLKAIVLFVIAAPGMGAWAHGRRIFNHLRERFLDAKWMAK